MMDVNYRTAALIEKYETDGFEAAVDFMEACLKQAQDGEEIVR